MDNLMVESNQEDIGLGWHLAFQGRDIPEVITGIAGQGNFAVVDSSVGEDKSITVDSHLAFIILGSLAWVNQGNQEVVSQVQGNLAWEDILAAVRDMREIIDLEGIRELIEHRRELQSLQGLQSLQELAIVHRKHLKQPLSLLQE